MLYSSLHWESKMMQYFWCDVLINNICNWLQLVFLKECLLGKNLPNKPQLCGIRIHKLIFVKVFELFK